MVEASALGLASAFAAGIICFLSPCVLPFVLSAAFAGAAVARLKALRRLGRGLQFAAGAIMILMGLAMVTGRLTAFGFWLLETFPALGRIG